jgi:hypothetical protein
VYKRGVETIQHRHTGRHTFAQSSRLLWVVCDAIPRALGLRVEPIVVLEQLVQLLEHFDTWLVRVFKLMPLGFRYLGELIRDVFKEVGEASSLRCELLVFACAVAAY